MRRLGIRLGLIAIACMLAPAPAHVQEPAADQLMQLVDSAGAGDIEAQYRLGVVYDEGKIVPRDTALAFQWFLNAAEQGNARAQTRVGLLYASGDGTQRSPEEAARWFQKAADQGEPAGQVNIGLAYLKGEGVAKDEARGAEWIRKAAEQGLAAAQSQLAMMYEQGRGVQPDASLALEWYRKAAAQAAQDRAAMPAAPSSPPSAAPAPVAAPPPAPVASPPPAPAPAPPPVAAAPAPAAPDTYSGTPPAASPAPADGSSDYAPAAPAVAPTTATSGPRVYQAPIGPDLIERSERRVAIGVVSANKPILLGHDQLSVESCDLGPDFEKPGFAFLPPPSLEHHIERRSDGTFDVAIALRDGASNPVLRFRGVRTGIPAKIRAPAVVAGGAEEEVSLELVFPATPACWHVVQTNVAAIEVARRFAAAAGLSIEGMDLLRRAPPVKYYYEAITAQEGLQLLADGAGVALEASSPTSFAFRVPEAAASK